ncbi:hypothetical protein I601_2028 [Nocardioides dokdonensis FR1436]|uniref:Uncharacterized protein n=1 Tax=Nocardioides dokdonensis FR1436 TaxID=1300347 RepID=A0A1A9GK49_9ACTN|nr:hypothetical protein [Nocardioides dokdonensis]ANH38456.1 hypothetical protein I601_2028 [Nocardioides dokdonensis FR1436]
MLLAELTPFLAPVLDLVRLVDEAPEPEDVKAGWGALAIFFGLAAAVALLGWSLFRQLRKVDSAEKAGVYGSAPTEAEPEPANGDDDRG